MTNRPVVLFVSPRLPQPLSTGTNIRIRHLLRALADETDVHWAGYGGHTEYDLFEQGIQDTWWRSCASMRSTALPVWPAFDDPHTYGRLVRNHPWARVPLMYSSFPCEPLGHMTRTMARAADLVWVERLSTAEALGLPAAKTVVDLDDLEAVKIERQAGHEPSRYGRWAMRREAARLKALEDLAPSKYSAVCVCSDEDARRWGERRNSVWVVPNGTDDELFDLEPCDKIPGRLIYVGTMSYWPNEQAVLHFLREVFPALVARMPGVTLDIVGRSPPPSVRSLHDGHRVFVHADVDSVVPFVQRASASIVPLLVGGGTRLKILESLALGTPVISTTIGAEGLSLTDGEHLLIGDSPAALVQSLVRLLGDAGLRAALTRQGRKRVSDLYRWSRIRERLADQVTMRIEELRSKSAAPARGRLARG